MSHEVNDEQDEALALAVLGWIVVDELRADRLLSLTGLTPDALRSSLGNRATLAAVMGFLIAHEADLLACADSLQRSPLLLAAVAARLDGGHGVEP